MNTIIKPNIQGVRAYEFQLFSTEQTWFKEMCYHKGLIHHKKIYFAWHLSCYKDTLLKLSFLFIFKSPQLSLYFDFINVIYVPKRLCKNRNKVCGFVTQK